MVCVFKGVNSWKFTLLSVRAFTDAKLTKNADNYTEKIQFLTFARLLFFILYSNMFARAKPPHPSVEPPHPGAEARMRK